MRYPSYDVKNVHLLIDTFMKKMEQRNITSSPPLLQARGEEPLSSSVPSAVSSCPAVETANVSSSPASHAGPPYPYSSSSPSSSSTSSNSSSSGVSGSSPFSSSASISSSLPVAPATISSHAPAGTVQRVRTPGERLGSISSFALPLGRGTYEKDGYVYAALVGVEHLKLPVGNAATSTASSAPSFPTSAAAPSENTQLRPTVSIVPLREPRAVLPVVGSIILAQVTKVSLLRVECSVLVVENQAVPEPFKGVVRAQDIRETDVDSVDVFESFQPADILRAKVISVADPRCYLLSTAAVHLGVLYAQGKDGGHLRPVTRRLMRCDVTGNLYRRKVAVPLPPQHKS